MCSLLTNGTNQICFSHTFNLYTCCEGFLLSRTGTNSVETTLSEVLSIPSEKGSTLKEKNFPPLGANSFHLE